MEIQCLIASVIGVIFGLVWGLMFPRKADGTFHIDRSNPKKDICRLEITDLDSVTKKKTLIIKVNANAHLSQD